MFLNRPIGLGLIVVVVAFGAASVAPAYIQMSKEPIAHRMAVADCVVLGKIAAIQVKPVMGQVWRYSERPQREYTIVEVDVGETFFGPKFPATKERARFGLLQFESYDPVPVVGQRGVFCGVMVGKNDYYTVPRGAYCGEKESTFAQDVEQGRHIGRVLAQPKGGLASQDRDERVIAAHMLILRSMFAPWRFGETGKAEPVDAELSKLALLALAEGDATKPEVRESLTWLGLAGKLGAPPAKNLPSNQADGDFQVAAGRWLRENAETYRIHRLMKEPTSSAKAK